MADLAGPAAESDCKIHCVDGVSLTVNAAENDVFSLMIIPHTAQVTTIGGLQIGAHVNLEVDLMARYAARLMQAED